MLYSVHGRIGSGIHPENEIRVEGEEKKKGCSFGLGGGGRKKNRSNGLFFFFILFDLISFKNFFYFFLRSSSCVLKSNPWKKRIHVYIYKKGGGELIRNFISLDFLLAAIQLT